MSCLISWMASLITFIFWIWLFLVLNWQHVNTLRCTIKGYPQKTLYRVRSPILFVRLVVLCVTSLNEAERSVWVNGPSSGKEQQCGSQSKMSGTCTHNVCAESESLVIVLSLIFYSDGDMTWHFQCECASAVRISKTHRQSIVNSVMTVVLASPKYAFAVEWGKYRGMYRV